MKLLLVLIACVGILVPGGLGVSGAETPFKIGQVTYDAAARQVVLEWSSQPGASYAVETSLDLNVWTPVALPVAASGSVTAYRVSPLPSAQQSYFRIRALGALALDSDPVLTLGHGAFVGADGQEFIPTAGFIEQAQKYYIRRLTNNVEGSFNTQTFIESLVKDKVLANALFLDWLLEKSRPEELVHLVSVNDALRWHYLKNLQTDPILPGPDQPWSKGIPSAIAIKLEAGGVVAFRNPPTGIQTYLNNCRECGVSMPPPLFSPGWVNLGVVDLPFIAESLVAELWIHKSPNGVCLALPRYTKKNGVATDDIEIFGVICLGTNSSKVCFFDNPPSVVFKRNVVTDISKFLGGADLYNQPGGICTDCHAGENPFVVHPQRGAFKAITTSLMPRQWYQPLVDPRWPQNPGPIALLDKVESAESCVDCHQAGIAGRFPDPFALVGYSRTVLGIATGTSGKRTMPVLGSSVGDRNPYTNHIGTLLSAYYLPIIIACADPNGAVTNGIITPDGRFTKRPREDQDFTATPDPGFEVDQWRVDGSNVQEGGTDFTLTNIQGSHTVQVTFRPPPDLEVTMPIPPSVVDSTRVTVTLQVSNLGRGPSKNVMLINSFADPGGNSFGVEIRSTSADQGTCFSAAGTTRCQLGTLPDQHSLIVTIVADLVPGIYFTRASVTASEADPNPVNNSVSTDFKVGVP